MLHDAVLLENLVEDVQRPAAIDHEILRNDLKPIDHRLARQNVLVMRHAQADADAVIRKSIKAIGWHSFLRGKSVNVRTKGPVNTTGPPVSGKALEDK